ncbi:MAG TPA: acyl-CoA thioesterase/bile acid-CoA:amino acid N-acyltransferase family protein [Vicinamibacterales bacterium]|nr:acyl-CoA thioesterase/bile acid-CoA:amino acid N-acyltransferase family protein [Vicinamibacterales bacterium]
MTRISVTPLDALLDQPVVIEVANLQPGSRVHLRLRNHTLRAEARAEFVASAEGRVNVAIHAPAAGDYAGIDPAGLFWSARFDAGSDVVSMIDVLSQLVPLPYTLTATADGRDAAVDFTRRLVAANVVRTPLRDGRLRGTLFTRNDAASSPGVIVLGGSDGGNRWAFVAALLAAHGFAALSLPYFGYEDLPREMIEIPLEYFADAIEWMRARPEVGAARVGVLGMSRGGEAALLLGASFDEVAAVVALVPSGVTGGGIGADFSAMGRSAWTLGGVPFRVFPPPGDPLTFQEAGTAFAAGTPFAGTPAMLRALESAGAGIEDVAIRVERTRGAIFMMSGEDDRLWPSTRLAEIAEKRLQATAFSYPFEHRRYPSAGHFACLPPNLPATSTAGRHPVVPMSFDFGGTARANAAASADLWPRIVTFLHRHLASAHE